MVLVRLLLYGCDYLLLYSAIIRTDAGIYILAAQFLTAHILLYVWQIVGLLRACDQYQKDYGSASLFWAVCFGIVVSFVFTASTQFSLVQVAFKKPAGIAQSKPAAPAYQLRHEDTFIVIEGEFTHGLTRELESRYLAAKNVTGVILESHGGNTFVGRGVAHIIRKHGLDTHVVRDCFSACVTAYIAGRTRTLDPAGRLGFHQYRIASAREIPFADIKREQEIDRAAFAAQGIDNAFLEGIFDAPRTEIWIPSAKELLAAGAIHRIGAP